MIKELVDQFSDGKITVYQLWDRIDTLLACQNSHSRNQVCCEAFEPCLMNFDNQIFIEKAVVSI